MTYIKIGVENKSTSWKSLKKVVMLIVILGIAVLDALIYWNSHLYHKAVEKAKDPQGKITYLQKANSFYGYNDQVYYELGRTYFDLFEKGVARDFETSRAYLEKSIENLHRAIQLNPTSAFSHFYYAQSLQYMSSISAEPGEDPYAEYKKAALLAGHNSDIYYWVATKFLERWDRLSKEDQDYIVQIIKRILGGQKRVRFLSILNYWAMGIKDYGVIRSMIPDDAQLYRQYAQFLGERSLSLEERYKALIKAELLDFQKAKDVHISAMHEFRAYQFKQAASLFQRVLNILKSICFYQNLDSSEGIDKGEFLNVQKSAYLYHLKSKIEQGNSLKECEADFLAYLDLEKSVAPIEDLETYLKDWKLLKGLSDIRLDEWDALFFQLNLYYKQNAYRDIINMGRTLQRSLIAVPPDMQGRYIHILLIIGDAFQKNGYMYDAEDFYSKALDVDSENLESALRLEQIYDRLNEKEKKKSMERKIRRLTSPRIMNFPRKAIPRGQGMSRALVFEGKKQTLQFNFLAHSGKQLPLVSIFFNNRVIWENYISQSVVDVPVTTKVGANILKVRPVNRNTVLVRIGYK